ncbi:MAG: hypothetical protein ACWGQW_01900 [bacterium]
MLDRLFFQQEMMAEENARYDYIQELRAEHDDPCAGEDIYRPYEGVDDSPYEGEWEDIPF